MANNFYFEFSAKDGFSNMTGVLPHVNNGVISFDAGISLAYCKDEVVISMGARVWSVPVEVFLRYPKIQPFWSYESFNNALIPKFAFSGNIYAFRDACASLVNRSSRAQTLEKIQAVGK